jgi:hypothetical protein
MRSSVSECATGAKEAVNFVKIDPQMKTHSFVDARVGSQLTVQ